MDSESTSSWETNWEELEEKELERWKTSEEQESEVEQEMKGNEETMY